MKVIHIIVGLGLGGAESMLFRLVSFSPEHKHVIVSLKGNGNFGSRFQEAGHEVICLHLRPLNFLVSILSLYNLIKKSQPDIVQTWMYHSDLIGGIVGRLAGAKRIIWNIRNTEIPQSRLSLTFLVVKLCSVASRYIPHSIVCNSNAGLESHVVLGYERKRMLVIPNGFNCLDWNPSIFDRKSLRDKYGLRQDALVVGIIGRHDPLKGYDVFVKAAALVSERYHARLLFVGAGRGVENSNPAFSHDIAQFGGDAEFRFIGEQRNIAEVVATLDVFCLASVAEGFPNVVAEAMLMQIPCVVTDVGDASKIVGDTGIVVPPRNHHALANGLFEMCKLSNEERMLRGAAARQRIIDCFDIREVAQRYSTVYSKREDNV